MKNSDADALLTLFSAPVGKFVTQAWASLNLTQLLAGINVEAQASTYFADTEGAAYGEIELEIAPPDQDATSKSGPFKQAYEDKYGEAPTYTAYISYDAIYVLKDALERAGSLNSADIQAALANTDYLGASYKIKFTSEPGSQLGVNSTGAPAPIPGAPENITVHDLFTPDGIGTRGKPYANPVFAQWQKNGVKKTIYGWADSVADETTDDLEWPINHADFGTIPGKAPPAPGFELPIVLVLLLSVATITVLRKRKN